jgi:DNA-directed RNA polymerase alpha subunit
MIEIPTYLRSRSFEKDDCCPLRTFSDAFGLSAFSEITADYLNDYSHKLKNLESFFCLLRILGLYGIVFNGRASKYSEFERTGVALLKMPPKLSGSLMDVSLGSKLRSFFYTYQYEELKHLNGMRVDVLSYQAQSSISELEQVFSRIGFDLVEGDNVDYFYHTANEKTDESIVRTEQEVKVVDVFSQNSSAILQEAGIHNLKELISFTPNQIKEIRNLRGHEFKEILGILTEHKLQLKDDGPDVNINDVLLSRTIIKGLSGIRVEKFTDVFYLSMTKLLNMRNCGLGAIEEIDALISYYQTRDPQIFELEDPLTKNLDKIFSWKNSTLLTKNGISNLRDLITLTPNQIKEIVGTKRRELKEILQILIKFKLRLRRDRLGANINDVLLSKRDIDVLSVLKIKKFSEVTQVSRDKLLNVRNCGIGTVEEIEALISYYQIQNLQISQTEVSIENNVVEVESVEENNATEIESVEDPLAKNLDSFLSKKLGGILARSGIFSLRELTSLTPIEIKEIIGSKRSDLKEIIQVLVKFKLRLQGDEPEANINDILLSIRATHILAELDIDKFSETFEVPKSEILRVRNSGRGTVEEIDALILYYQKTSKLESTPDNRIVDIAIPEDILAKNLDSILNRGLRSILAWSGISTLKDLISLTPLEIKEIIGAKSSELKEIIQILVKFKLKLRGDESEANINNVLLSTRAIHILSKLGIDKFSEAFDVPKSEILKVRNSGKGTVEEIATLISYYKIMDQERFGLEDTLEKDLCDVPLSDKVKSVLKNMNVEIANQILGLTPLSIWEQSNCDIGTLAEIVTYQTIHKGGSYNYYTGPIHTGFWTTISETLLSVRATNAMEAVGIEFVWQLLESSPDKFMKLPNFGKNTLNEIYQYLDDNQLPRNPINFSPEQIELFSIAPQEDKVEGYCVRYLFELPQLIDDRIVEVFDERSINILSERIPFTRKGKTFEALGKIHGITRERIRQICKNAESTLAKIFSIRGIIESIEQKTSTQGGILSFDTTAPTQDRHREIIEGIIDWSKAKISIDWDAQHISFCYENEGDLFDRVKSDLDTQIESKFEITLSEVKHSVKNTFECQLDRDGCDLGQVLEKAVQVFVKRYLRELKDGVYTFQNTPLTDLTCHMFGKLYPEGAAAHRAQEQIRDEIGRYIPEILKREKSYIPNLFMRREDDVFLWGFGIYIHKNNVNADWKLIDKVIKDCKRRFNSGIGTSLVPNIRAPLLFKTFEGFLRSSGVPNSTALYSLIKYRNDPNLITNDYPNIRWRKKQKKNKTIPDMVLDYFVSKNGPISRNEQIKFFCEDRGWELYEVSNQISAHEGLISIQGIEAVARKFVTCNREKLIELSKLIAEDISQRNAKLHLRVFKKRYPVLWGEINNYSYSIPLMGRLLSELENFPLKITGSFVLPEVIDRNITLCKSMEEWCLDYKSYLTRNQIINEFKDNRGYSESSVQGHISESDLLAYGPDEFIHPNLIDYQRDWETKISEVLNAVANNNNRNGFLHTKFEHIIEEFEDSLPQINSNYYWTLELLSDIASSLVTISIFHNVYVLNDNDSNISTLDELIAYLIVTNFGEARCQLYRLERFLQGEQIISISGKIPRLDAFYDGSMIQLVDNGTFVQLSKDGRERFFYNG